MAAIAGTGCDRPAPPASGPPPAPRRVISLAPSLTEVIFACGAGPKLVGVTDFCNFPPQTRGLPTVGGFSDPNLERIIGLRPDLLVATRDGSPPETVRAAEQAGIRLLLVDTPDFDGILTSIRTIGRELGCTDRAREVIAEMTRRREAVQQAVAGRTRPRVLFAYSADPVIAAGPGSFGHDLIRLAGGSNIAADADTRYPHLSLETVLARDPEVILIESSMANPTDPAAPPAGEWGRWPSLAAVRTNRVHVVDADLVDRPGPRVVEGLEQIARFLHPGAFDNPREK